MCDNSRAGASKDRGKLRSLARELRPELVREDLVPVKLCASDGQRTPERLERRVRQRSVRLIEGLLVLDLGLLDVLDELRRVLSDSGR